MTNKETILKVADAIYSAGYNRDTGLPFAETRGTTKIKYCKMAVAAMDAIARIQSDGCNAMTNELAAKLGRSAGDAARKEGA